MPHITICSFILDTSCATQRLLTHSPAITVPARYDHVRPEHVKAASRGAGGGGGAPSMPPPSSAPPGAARPSQSTSRSAGGADPEPTGGPDPDPDPEPTGCPDPDSDPGHGCVPSGASGRSTTAWGGGDGDGAGGSGRGTTRTAAWAGAGAESRQICSAEGWVGGCEHGEHGDGALEEYEGADGVGDTGFYEEYEGAEGVGTSGFYEEEAAAEAERWREGGEEGNGEAWEEGEWGGEGRGRGKGGGKGGGNRWSAASQHGCARKGRMHNGNGSLIHRADRYMEGRGMGGRGRAEWR